METLLVHVGIADRVLPPLAAIYRDKGVELRDQLFYLHRCGFDAFALRADKDPYEALESLKDFSVTYQAATDEPLPLFRRR